jgi:hypothetical protein
MQSFFFCHDKHIMSLVSFFMIWLLENEKSHLALWFYFSFRTFIGKTEYDSPSRLGQRKRTVRVNRL